VLAAALLSAPFEIGASWWKALRWIPTGASLLAVALAARAATPRGIPFEHWTPAESAAVSDQAVRRGWSYEDLVFRIQGSACRELLTRMSLTAPLPGAPPRDGGRRLQVVKVAGDATVSRAPSLTLAPRGWSEDVVPLGPGTFALLREVDSWLRPEALRACRTPLDPSGPPVCSPADLRMVETRGGERFLFSTRAFPEIHGLHVGPPYRGAPKSSEKTDPGTGHAVKMPGTQFPPCPPWGGPPDPDCCFCRAASRAASAAASSRSSFFCRSSTCFFIWFATVTGLSARTI